MRTVVAVVGSRVEADIVAGLLRDNGIPASVSSDDAGGMQPALQAQGVRVLVSEQDADAAAELLTEVEPPVVVTHQPRGLARWALRRLGGTVDRG